MAQDLLLEIGVEEMPSAYMPGAVRDLQELAQQLLGDARLEWKELKVYATPRRLVLYVKQLAEQQRDAVIENRGPKKQMAFDEQGNPTKACQGFARGQGVNVEDLQVKEVNGIEYVFAVKKLTGQATLQVLPELLTGLITSIPFPKSMRWGYYHLRFARPIRWLVALFGDQVIPIEIENLKGGRTTWGHRFLAPEPLTVANPDDYMRQLESNYVVLDQQARREMIWKQVQEAAAEAGGTPMENPDLLEEINYLVEYPTAFTGRFSESYLQVPPEVLTTTMINNQRYFPIYDESGRLMPAFAAVRNGNRDHLDNVRAGNERVLRARLEDALFFWNEDNKKPLEAFNQGLADVLFQERLGTLERKVQRLEAIALYLCRETGWGKPELVKRAAQLSKADLLSSMVYEFPELQGIMGRYYAQNSGEDPQVAQAIFEHYLPRFAGDQLPQSEVGTVLSLAEKIHNLMGCFCIGIKPTGSQDPYALRRQALGLVHIIMEHRLNIDLQQVFREAYRQFTEVKPDVDEETAVGELLEFVLQRMKGVLAEQKFSYDVIDSVMAKSTGYLLDIYNRAQIVQELKKSPLFEDFMVVFNRSHNLSKKWQQTTVLADVLQDDSEKELYQQLTAVQSRLSAPLDYHQLIKDLADLRPYVDRFFESVMVMVEDEKLKENRLSLLRSIAGLCQQVADFSKIVQ
ncbi:MAG TPA: glycine--tRNA ligase subunit beta [Syntrophomonadaceae bacterium]|nr:glycine--tRNA ligase subunit beta [Syntrophomonadaceae bacterium]HOQ09800.1 glycine--tRNA ligase subunit beta [Syntrophomonadaceae bacterium]